MNCQFCKKEIERRGNESAFRFSHRIFCSNKCSAQSRSVKRREITSCLFCNITIYGFKNAHRQFCSSTCHDKFRVGKPMHNAGQFKKGIIPPTAFKKGEKTVLHNEKCTCFRCDRKIGSKHHGWKGGITIGGNKVFYSRHVAKLRRARLMKAEGFYTQDEWLALKEKYGNMCLCCKEYEPFIELTVDHIIPLSRGGSNYISNIQPLCRSCNSRKRTSIINFIKTPYANIIN